VNIVTFGISSSSELEYSAGESSEGQKLLNTLIDISFSAISCRLHNNNVFYPMYYDSRGKHVRGVVKIKSIVGVDEVKRL